MDNRTCVSICDWLYLNGGTTFKYFDAAKTTAFNALFNLSSVNQFNSIGFIDRSTALLNYSMDTNTGIPGDARGRRDKNNPVRLRHDAAE